MIKIISAIFAIFFLLFIFQANFNMWNSPFNEFDEAHRAENAKRMAQYQSYFVPLTGSPQDRSGQIRVPFKENPLLFIYYHLERPAFIYDLMIISSALFGDFEWSYRLPSFIFGMSTLILFTFFIVKIFKGKNYLPLYIGLIALLTSRDLWLSSQYAQLDTGLTFFLLLSLLAIIRFVEIKSKRWLWLSAISFGLAIFSKGQPAVIFFIPIAYLWLTKKFKTTEVLEFILLALVIILPWVMYISIKFGLWNLLDIFFGFATTSVTVPFIHNEAPIYWYLRWWVFSFRTGLVLFSVLFIQDLLTNRLDWQKKISLCYILGSLLALSLPVNKLWWYALPLVPVVCYYIYISSKDHLKKVGKRGLINLSMIITLSSLPILLGVRSSIALIYYLVLTIVSVLILRVKIGFDKRFQKPILAIAILFSLVCFYYRFPQIIPYDKGIKPVATYFSALPERKCLYILDLPPESALFYSDAGEVILLTEGTVLVPECKNYLITSRDIAGQKVVYENNNLKLYKLEGSQIK